MRLALGIVLLAATSLCCDDTITVQDGSGIQGRVTASPICPVETDPPQPGCEPAPLKDVVIEVRDASGRLVNFGESAGDGSYEIDLAPGDYSVCALPLDLDAPLPETSEPPALPALPTPPAPVDVTVPAGARVTVDFDYDTGIR